MSGNREVVDLAFIVLGLPGSDGIKRYALQLNPHLNSYNYFGGHIDRGESPRDAVLRELREELGSVELVVRWGIQLTDDVPHTEWASMLADLREIPGQVTLPFMSLRAQREGRPQERLATIHLFELDLSGAKCPHILKRLTILTESKTLSPWDGEERAVCRMFDADELLDYAWKTPHNPFFRHFLKRRIIECHGYDDTTLPFVLCPARFERWIETRLHQLLGHTLGVSGREALAVTVIPPGQEEVNLALASNQSLQADIEIRWSGSAEVYRVRVPYPHHGVFILRSESSSRSGRWIWHPRMKPVPGAWHVRKFAQSTVKNQVSVTLGGLGGPWNYDIDVDTKRLKKSIDSLGKRLKGRRVVLLPAALVDDSEYGDLWPSGNGEDFGLFLYGSSEKAAFVKGMVKSCSCLQGEGRDEQDLGYQRLVTYPAWLGETLLLRVLKQFLGAAGNQAVAVAGDMRNGTDVDADLVLSMWNRMCQGLGGALPLVDVQGLRSKGWLHAFEPLNAIQAASELTSFQRYDMPSDSLKDLPASWRQNHPSFDGLVCPVESPENPKVGIALHLGRGVTTDMVGRLHGASVDGLGYAASLVPFFEFNDAPRSMMGAKNMKQAVPLSGSEPPLVRTGSEVEARDLVAPLDSVVPGLAADHSLEPGVNLLVAYMPWYGWNFEDAIVANARLAEDGLLDWHREEAFEMYIHPGFEPSPPESDSSSALRQALMEALFLDKSQVDKRSFRKYGSIMPGDPIAYFRNRESGQIVPVNHQGEGPGELVEILYSNPASSLFGGRLAWRVRYSVSLTPGDKLMGRHGNKGIIGKMFPSGELPHLPDDSRLPDDLRGRAVDLVLNPHGVISRMNIGQLMETQVGLVRAIRPDALPESVGRAFSELNVTKGLRTAYADINGTGADPLIDEFGRMRLTLPGGKTTTAPVTVGMQYIVRLKHIPAYKAQARRGNENDALYQAITGQPAGGRRNRGGQRVGEMEIWALAAHRAEENLREILGIKSDPSSERGLQTMQAVSDHLYALGIEFEEEDGHWRIQPARYDENGSAVSGGIPWVLGVRGNFSCPRPGCQHHFPRKDVLSQSITGRGVRYLSLGDVLQHEHLALAPGDPSVSIEATEDPRRMKFVLHDIATGSATKRMTANLKRRKKDLGGSLAIGKLELQVYRQVNEGKPFTLSELTSLAISCPQHKNSLLSCTQPRFELIPRPGGLLDPDLSGTADILDPDTRWAFIDLPFEVSPNIYERRESGIPPIRRLPVLPLKYRYSPPRIMNGTPVSAHERLPQLYDALMKAIDSYSSSKEDFRDFYAQRINDLVSDIYRLIWKRLSGKEGLMRRQGLGRRVNRSGRLVIAPDPELGWDECGVPVEVLAHLLADKIAGWEGLAGAVGDHLLYSYLAAWESGRYSEKELEANLQKEIRSPEFWKSLDWLQRGSLGDFMVGVKSVVDAYLREHPETRVLLNRAPSLHKYNFTACKPLALEPGMGLVLRINPLVCKGLAADFDGDEISIHVPESELAHREAAILEPTQPQNLLSVANGHSLAHLDQDFVLGHYLLLQTAGGEERLRQVFDGVDISKEYLADPAQAQELLDHICRQYPSEAAALVPDWMRLTFEAVTEAAISFGYIELVEIRPDIAGLLEDVLPGPLNETMGQHMENLNKELGDKTLSRLREVVDSGDVSAPAYGFAAMAVSGARGKKQTRQLIAARGFLNPGEIAFGGMADDFFIRKALVDGMSRRDAFWSAMNGRSSMIDKKLGTPRAGGLTRSLVLACWPWYVTGDDCGVSVASSEARTISDCAFVEAGEGVCATCYGKVVGYGDSVPVGYPAGLIAAQSVGERGTQLSMQSFHTGTRALSMRDVEAIFQGRDPDAEPGESENWFARDRQAGSFAERIKQVNAYSEIDERHLVLIWHAIHSCGAGTLRNVPRFSRNIFSAIAAGNQWEGLQALMAEPPSDGSDLLSPFEQLLMSEPPGFDGGSL